MAPRAYDVVLRELRLKPHLDGYRVFDETFNYCFNSYYESQGPRQPRPKRGLLTRPSAERVLAYRAHVDAALETLLSRRRWHRSAARRALIEIGINHEQQHQELLLTDILRCSPQTRCGRPIRRRAVARGRCRADTVALDRIFAGGIHRRRP